MMNAGASVPLIKRKQTKVNERAFIMSFQFPPSELSGSTLVNVPPREQQDDKLVAGWWILPFFLTGLTFWFWLVPAMIQSLF